jgi:tetratricopeptide (TPR) repeat protein
VEDYERAIADYSQAIALEPTASCYHNRGLTYAILEQYERAIADYDQAEALDPNVALLYGNRGNAYYRLGQYGQAIADYSQAITLEPTASRYHNRGNAYRRLHHDYEEVIAGRKPPSSIDADLYHRRGDVYQRLVEDYERAIADYSQAIALEPTASCYHNRGLAYAILEQYEQAIADFEYVLELAPNYHNSGGLYNELRWAYYKTGKYQQALSANDHLLEQDPGDYHIFRSRCFRSLKDYQQSIEACNCALELVPKESDAYFQRGLTYLWLKDLGQAQADFTQSCKLKPTKIDVALLIEWVGICQGAADLLVAERLETIAELDPGDYLAYVTHICLGMALLLHRNLRGALAELEQALVPMFHEEWKVYFWKGMICAFLEQDEEAIVAIEKALDLELPPILLAPLNWFEQERPDFYGKYVASLLKKHA